MVDTCCLDKTPRSHNRRERHPRIRCIGRQFQPHSGIVGRSCRERRIMVRLFRQIDLAQNQKSSRVQRRQATTPNSRAMEAKVTFALSVRVAGIAELQARSTLNVPAIIVVDQHPTRQFSTIRIRSASTVFGSIGIAIVAQTTASTNGGHLYADEIDLEQRVNMSEEVPMQYQPLRNLPFLSHYLITRAHEREPHAKRRRSRSVSRRSDPMRPCTVPFQSTETHSPTTYTRRRLEESPIKAKLGRRRFIVGSIFCLPKKCRYKCGARFCARHFKNNSPSRDRRRMVPQLV
jgi:hypothetical protein